jgi:hypothetical protein
VLQRAFQASLTSSSPGYTWTPSYSAGLPWTISAMARAFLGSIYGTNWPGGVGGGACHDFDKSVLNCMLSFCNGLGFVSCNGPGCPGACAYTCLLPLLPICMITFCFPQASQPANCSDVGGDTSLNPISFNFLHELGHCCGVQHGNHPDWAQCNDMMSCCILEVMHGVGDPSNKCARHIP